MPKGDLLIHISDLRGNPLREAIEMEFEPFSGELGTGGEAMEVSFKTGTAREIQVTGIPCRGGPGTLYRVSASAPHYRVYSFFQLIQENRVNQASDDIEFWISPRDVVDIRAPKFDELPANLRRILTDAQMLQQGPADKDLVSKSGSSLYQSLGPLRKACLLNIARKTLHRTADNCLPFITALLICRQDRFFAFVEPLLLDRIRASSLYKSAPAALHKPLKGFELTGASFKTRDAHANLQITFMRHLDDGKLAADLDIDEFSGIEHGFEVIKNAMFRKRTNPYLIREFMLSADLVEHSLDPGYEFVF